MFLHETVTTEATSGNKMILERRNIMDNPSWQLSPTHLVQRPQWDGGENQRRKSEKAHVLR